MRTVSEADHSRPVSAGQRRVNNRLGRVDRTECRDVIIESCTERRRSCTVGLLQPWTDAEDRLVAHFHNKGLDDDAIADQLARRVAAVRGRRSKLGLI
jgi:hypothetical protein